MTVIGEDSRLHEDRCPPWCALEHTGDAPALLHEGETCALPLSRRYDPAVPESMDVRVVLYVSDDPSSEGVLGLQTIELAHHVGPRYRVINLSPAEARRLADTLLTCADQTGE